MKVWAYENTKLKRNSFINRYDLTTFLNDFEPDTFNLKIKEKTLKATTAKIEIATNKQYDFFIIENYPFFNKAKTYFFLTNKEFLNNTNGINIYAFSLELAPFLTFSFDEIFNNQKIPVEQKHINEFLEFEDYNNKILKDKNIFQFENNTPYDLKMFDKKIINVINAQNEKLLIRNFGISKWGIAFCKKDIISSKELEPSYFFTKKTSNKREEQEGIKEEIKLFVFPLVNKFIAYRIEDENGNLIGERTFNGWELYNWFKNNPNTLNIILLDYPPSQRIFSQLNGGKIIFKGNGFNYTDASPESAGSAVIWNKLNKDYIRNTFKIKNEKIIFNWTPENNIFDGTENDFFKNENSIMLNFAPYKYFKIGIYGETNDSGWMFNNNNKKQLINKNNKVLFYRIFNPSSQTFELIDEPKEGYINFNNNNDQSNYLFGERTYKTKRDLFLPLFTDAWEEQNVNKKLNGLTDFLLPAAGLAATAFFPEGKAITAAAKIGFSLSATNTLINRRQTKNTPDTQTQAGTSAIGEAFLYYDTRTLTIYEPAEENKSIIAYSYHYAGVFLKEKMFNFNNLFESNFYSTRKRFNFIKLNNLSSLKIFDNSKIEIIDVKILILEILRQGAHFWNFKNYWNAILKSYNFKYQYKNPIEEENLLMGIKIKKITDGTTTFNVPDNKTFFAKLSKEINLNDNVINYNGVITGTFNSGNNEVNISINILNGVYNLENQTLTTINSLNENKLILYKKIKEVVLFDDINNNLFEINLNQSFKKFKQIAIRILNNNQNKFIIYCSTSNQIINIGDDIADIVFFSETTLKNREGQEYFTIKKVVGIGKI